MALDIAIAPKQDLDTFRLVSRWVMRIKDEQNSHAWTKVEYDRMAVREKIAALQSARASLLHDKDPATPASSPDAPSPSPSPSHSQFIRFQVHRAPNGPGESTFSSLST